MATTPNYGFVMPDPTDFVTDLPADFEIFGDEVDARIKALNPETTAGDISYRAGTANAKTRLGIGTAGQVLTVNSGATAPEWTTLSSGGMTLIAATASNGVANIIFSSIPSTYKHLLLVWDEIENLSSATQLEIRFNNATTNYNGMDIKRAEPSTFNASAFASGANVNNSRTDLATSGQPNGGHLWVYDYASTTRRKVYSGASRGYSANFTGEAGNVFNGYYRSTSAITSLEFRGQNTLGNGGQVRLYGVN